MEGTREVQAGQADGVLDRDRGLAKEKYPSATKRD
jgi:hypothetical protein